MRLRTRVFFSVLAACGGLYASGAPAGAVEIARVGGPGVATGAYAPAVPACRRLQLALDAATPREPGRPGLFFLGRASGAPPLLARLRRAAPDGRMAFAGSPRAYGGFTMQTVVRWHFER